METLEIMRRLVAIHNRIVQVVVSGDNAILVGDSIRDLRLLVQELEPIVKAEQQAKSNQPDSIAIAENKEEVS